MSLAISTTIDTPCGPVTVTVRVPIDLPAIPSLPLPIPFPPAFTIPMPDCSLLKHIGSAEEPADDSVP